MARDFRSRESYIAERTTRDMLRAFLSDRGFARILDTRKNFGETQSQIVEAHDEAGKEVRLWVRLCWRKGGDREGRGYSAAQLTARVDADDWEGTIAEKMNRQRAVDVTHLLLIQRAGNSIVYAAALPIGEVVSIWSRQRDVSRATIESGRLGRRTKNHAMNGSSLTLWLQDDEAPAVGEALWQYPGVRDLAKLPLISLGAGDEPDDSVNDLPCVDYAALGDDGAPRVQRIVSGIRRDARVRDAVRQRCNNVCERASCGAHRTFPGFVDVHHILGADKNDRVWTCVALCPNCHREAHVAPNRDELNAELLEFALRFRPPESATLVV